MTLSDTVLNCLGHLLENWALGGGGWAGLYNIRHNCSLCIQFYTGRTTATTPHKDDPNPAGLKSPPPLPRAQSGNIRTRSRRVQPEDRVRPNHQGCGHCRSVGGEVPTALCWSNHFKVLNSTKLCPICEQLTESDEKQKSTYISLKHTDSNTVKNCIIQSPCRPQKNGSVSSEISIVFNYCQGIDNFFSSKQHIHVY